MTDCSSTGNGSEKNSKNIQNTYFGKEKKLKLYLPSFLSVSHNRGKVNNNNNV